MSLSVTGHLNWKKEMDINKQLYGEPVFSKAIRIAESIIGTAEAISSQFKDYPVPHKYRRRTNNFKKKQRLFWLRMHLTAFMGAVQASSIAAQPVPKFPKGGFIGDTGKPEIVQGDFDVPHKVSDETHMLDAQRYFLNHLINKK